MPVIVRWCIYKMSLSRLRNDFSSIEKIGSGAFGEVYQGLNNTDKMEYAIKVVDMPPKKEEKTKFLREVKVWSRCNHKNVVRYHYAWIEKSLESSCSSTSSIDFSRTELYEKSGSLESFSSSSSSTDSSRIEHDKACTLECSPIDPEQSLFPHNLKMSEETEQAYCGGGKLHIVMELCQGNLEDWLFNRQKPRLDPYTIIEHILCAVSYFHSQNWMHRDLKPSNILFGYDGTIKIGDLGLIKEFSNNTLETGNVNDTTSCEHTGEIGTPSYMSPEQKEKRNYNHKVDIYALGLIFVELLHPYKTAIERVNTLSDARLHKFPSGFEKNTVCLLKKMLSVDATERPEVDQILKDFQLIGLPNNGTSN